MLHMKVKRSIKSNLLVEMFDPRICVSLMRKLRPAQAASSGLSFLRDVEAIFSSTSPESQF